MALINCEECGQRISDKAECCPHCGCPVNSSNATEEFVQESEFPEEPKRKNKGLLCGIIAVVVILIGAGVWWALSVYGNTSLSKEVKITPEFIEAVHQYDELYSYSEGLAAVKKDGKYGFIDTEGNLVIPCKFFGVGAFSEGLAAVYDDKYNVSFINPKGETVLTTPYQIQYNLYNQGGDNPNYIDNLYLNDVKPVEFIHGICKIPEAGPEGYWEDVYINTKGEKVTEPAETDGTTETPKEEFSIFEDENTHKFGVKDASGKVVVPAQYSHIDKFSNGVARFYNNIHGDFIDYQDMRRGQYEGEEILTRVYGYIDMNGNSTYTDADSKKAIEWKKNQQAVVNARHLREEAEEEAQRQAEEETRRGPEWLDGTWEWAGYINLGYGLGTQYMTGRIVINRDSRYGYSYINGSLNGSGNYTIEDGKLTIHDNGIGLASDIDYENQRIGDKGENLWYHKTN